MLAHLPTKEDPCSYCRLNSLLQALPCVFLMIGLPKHFLKMPGMKISSFQKSVLLHPPSHGSNLLLGCVFSIMGPSNEPH